jgi:hypothetical protein
MPQNVFEKTVGALSEGSHSTSSFSTGKSLTKKIRSRLALCALAVLLCLGATNIRAQNTYNLTCITCGNWNSAGIHDPTTLYQIGYSYTRPNPQIAYFEFDLTPVMGKTVTNAGITIPGSTDYSINSYWVTKSEIAIKVGIRPQSTNYPETLSQILTGNNSTSLYVNVEDPNRNQDLSYDWMTDGFHFGFEFGAFFYNPQRFQAAVTAGGDYILWAVDDDDIEESGATAPENYIWGSTSYNTGIILTITTSN